MLVSPTTLLVALRTIANLWRYEHQSRNAQQIADRASKLYDDAFVHQWQVRDWSKSGRER